MSEAGKYGLGGLVLAGGAFAVRAAFSATPLGAAPHTASAAHQADRRCTVRCCMLEQGLAGRHGCKQGAPPQLAHLGGMAAKS